MVNSDIVDIALEVLSEVMNDPECKSADRVSAAKAILDIYNLKTSATEMMNSSHKQTTYEKVNKR